MPRIIQLAPDGGGRDIAVDRDGDLWRSDTKRQTERWRRVHRVETAALDIPAGQLMIAAMYHAGLSRSVATYARIRNSTVASDIITS